MTKGFAFYELKKFFICDFRDSKSLDNERFVVQH